MKLIALMTAIGPPKAAKGIAWADELIADAAVWVIDQCEPHAWR